MNDEIAASFVHPQANPRSTGNIRADKSAAFNKNDNYMHYQLICKISAKRGNEDMGFDSARIAVRGITVMVGKEDSTV
ncbi:hypothetical protein B4923_02120 [Brenneria roseae subsp. americana]|uniref:Uncharacterized protein n=1 Tax=Brenneria roseae subsp. americana TaxID=1508507 RepID=A0A2U1TZP7_9GAMM|nr:hypothetical protein [Brenneria roseae]PWC14864.1 hypothetical protein B4923_02120 [Brenneria roseae subsp. americana]